MLQGRAPHVRLIIALQVLQGLRNEQERVRAALGSVRRVRAALGSVRRVRAAVKPPPIQPSQGRTQFPPFKGGFEVDEPSSPPLK